MREKVEEAVEFLRHKFPASPDIGVVLGSGLGEYAESFSKPISIPYSEIPHFPQSTVVGHKGHLIFQQFETCAVVAMQGRFHYYEGYRMEPGHVSHPSVRETWHPTVNSYQCRRRGEC